VSANHQQPHREAEDRARQAAAHHADREDDEQKDIGVAAEDVHLREADDLRDHDDGAEHGQPGDDPRGQDHFL
jgi:hypothetical protein